MISFDDDLSDFRRDEPSEDIFGPPSSSSSKLASLFGDESAAAPVESKPAPKPVSTAPRPVTLFSSVAHIYVPDPTTGSYASYGRGGVALIARADTKTLLLYTATKVVLTQLPLSSSFPLSLSHPYLYFTAVDAKKWSIAFDDDAVLSRILAWYLLIVKTPTTVYDLRPGIATAPLVEEGDALLLGLTVFTVNGDALSVKEEADAKLRLSARRHKHIWEHHLIGLRKSAIRMIYSSGTVYLVTVKKVKQRESDSEPRTEGSDTVSKDTVPKDATVTNDTLETIYYDTETGDMPSDTVPKDDTIKITVPKIATPNDTIEDVLAHLPIDTVPKDTTLNDTVYHNAVSGALPKDTVTRDDTLNDTVYCDSVSEPTAESVSVSEESIAPEATVLQRMAKLGKPMLGLAGISLPKPLIVPPLVTPPTVSSPPAEEEPASVPLPVEQATVSQELATVLQSTAIDPSPTVPQSSYAEFHRVIGLEMDRLQIRLEASFSRMLQESLGPIKDQLSRLEERQALILQKMQSTRSD